MLARARLSRARSTISSRLVTTKRASRGQRPRSTPAIHAENRSFFGRAHVGRRALVRRSRDRKTRPSSPCLERNRVTRRKNDATAGPFSSSFKISRSSRRPRLGGGNRAFTSPPTPEETITTNATNRRSNWRLAYGVRFHEWLLRLGSRPNSHWREPERLSLHGRFTGVVDVHGSFSRACGKGIRCAATRSGGADQGQGHCARSGRVCKLHLLGLRHEQLRRPRFVRNRGRRVGHGRVRREREAHVTLYWQSNGRSRCHSGGFSRASINRATGVDLDDR